MAASRAMMPSTPPTTTPDSLAALARLHAQLGASLAGDGIPLHYGDLAGEYEAALTGAVLMDRSHEGRLRLSGRDRLAIPHRISTNALETLLAGSCAPTLFTTPNARIIDRVITAHLGETALMLTEPGRGAPVMGYLRRNIFFNDDLRIADESPDSRQFVLVGRLAAPILAKAGISLEPLQVAEAALDGVSAVVLRDKPLGGETSGDLWRVIVPAADAPAVWSGLLAMGKMEGLRPAGSLTYHALRIRAGRPGVGAELSGDYIPLEVGLWDEISFSKGCYTGQEIIARMESRRRLARTIVRVTLSAPIKTPAPMQAQGRNVGMLTSAVTTPRGEHLGIAVVKVGAAQPGAVLNAAGSEKSEAVQAVILDRAGVQPDLEEDS